MKINKYLLNVGDVFIHPKNGHKYVVYKTLMDGGGTAMYNDYYPDGHHVYAQRLHNNKWDEDGPKIDFYQTGCFSKEYMIKNVEVVGKMKMIFITEEE